jgi:hypothetical protein
MLRVYSFFCVLFSCFQNAVLVREKWYPLPEFSCLHSRQVPFFRASEANGEFFCACVRVWNVLCVGYRFLEKPAFISVLTAAAYRHPPRDSNQRVTGKWCDCDRASNLTACSQ